MTASKNKINNGDAIGALDFDSLTPKQLDELEKGVKAQRRQRSAARNLSVAAAVGQMMPQTSDAPLSEA